MRPIAWPFLGLGLSNVYWLRLAFGIFRVFRFWNSGQHLFAPSVKMSGFKANKRQFRQLVGGGPGQRHATGTVTPRGGKRRGMRPGRSRHAGGEGRPGPEGGGTPAGPSECTGPRTNRRETLQLIGDTPKENAVIRINSGSVKPLRVVGRPRHQGR